MNSGCESSALEGHAVCRNNRWDTQRPFPKGVENGDNRHSQDVPMADGSHVGTGNKGADCTESEGGFDWLNYGTIHGQKLF
jgi:hypothetical protein